MNVESAVWTLAQAMRIVEAVDHDSFGICLDAWNIWQNADILEEIRRCGDRIFVVQFSDWRTPRSFQDRLVSGRARSRSRRSCGPSMTADTAAPTASRYSHGDVPDSLWQADLHEVIRRSHAGLDIAWHAAMTATAEQAQ